MHLSLCSCQEDTFFDVFVCHVFYISFILMLKEDHLPRHSQTRPTYYSGTSIKRLMAKDRWIMFARRCNRRSFVISRFFSVYFSVSSRWYILYCFYIKIVFIIIIYIKTANTSNVQTRRLYTYAVNQSTLSSTTKSICFLQIHCI